MKKNKILFVVGLSTLLFLVLGATYAYFQVNVNNNTTNSSVLGSTNKYGTVTLNTNTSKLYLKLTNDEMTEDYIGTTYYANSSSTETPLTSDPNYTLATSSLVDGDLPLDCTYNFKVTATVKTAITDGSDEDVKITIGNTTKTLKELTTAGTNGVVITGTIKNLITGENQTIGVSSTLLNSSTNQSSLTNNSSTNQSSLTNNSYTITIIPYTSGDTKSFSCKLSEKTFAETLITSGTLWQSGLEGDGYRYVGSGAVGTETNPNNFICFGTTSKSDCTTNQDKYMYRILGIFPDSNGEQHVKLIKYKQSGIYAYNGGFSENLWENSEMYKGLNGNYFLTNTTYDYLQNITWLEKIANWTWSAVNTLTYSNSGPDYYDSVSPKEIYLHEMNRSSKTSNIGSWITPTAKIGLMYVSDYVLSLGSNSLELTTGTGTNAALLKTDWIHQSNNDTTKGTLEWTLSLSGVTGGLCRGWIVSDNGSMGGAGVLSVSNPIRPVFYLSSSETVSSGDGSLDNPYILEQ